MYSYSHKDILYYQATSSQLYRIIYSDRISDIVMNIVVTTCDYSIFFK